jgi:RNA polymerase sigma factor (sigma-70 family)
MKHQERNDLWLNFIRGGDDEALSILYNCYVHQLFSYGLKIHGDGHLIKDCIQEVFIHLIDKRKKLKLTGSSQLYLFKSLRNKLMEELRSKNRRIEIVKSIALSEDNHEISLEQSMVQSEEEHLCHNKMLAALDKLSDYQKEAIYLKYSQGFEYEIIAEILDINIASSRMLVYRSIKKMKDFLFMIPRTEKNFNVEETKLVKRKELLVHI